jgi:hypothetical protein
MTNQKWVVSRPVLKAIAASCFTWCTGVLGGAITSVTHQPWLGVSFAVAGVIGLVCLFRSTI